MFTTYVSVVTVTYTTFVTAGFTFRLNRPLAPVLFTGAASGRTRWVASDQW